MTKETISSTKETVVIGLAGDTMLGRLVNTRISQTNYQYPWGDVLPILKKTDLNLINLETALTKSVRKVPKVFNFKADPDKVQSLVEARIDVCNLANNHILDFSEEGLLETISTLDKAGIKHVGAGVSQAEAAEPVIIKKKNISIGIIGYTDNEPEWQAKENKPGTNYAEVEDIENIKKEIKKLRPQVDLLIFTMHWGPNMRQRPIAEFKDFAHQLVDLGVDVFHGHSAHIFQGIEVYKEKLILYDTGEFVDDYYVTPSLRNDQSFLYLIEADKEGLKKVQLVPVLISKMQVNKAVDNNYRQAVERVRMLSQELGTEIKETEQGIFVSL